MTNISHAPFYLDYGRDFGGRSFPWQPLGKCDDQWSMNLGISLIPRIQLYVACDTFSDKDWIRA